MTGLVRALPVLVAACVVACSQPAPAPVANAPADLEAIGTLRAAVAAAYNAGDAVALGNTYTDGAVSMTNMQPTATGRAAIVAAQTATFSQFGVSMRITPEETRTLDSSGFERGRYTLNLTPKAGGSPTMVEGRYVVILEKGADGRWLISHDMDNTAAPPPAPAATTQTPSAP